MWAADVVLKFFTEVAHVARWAVLLVLIAELNKIGLLISVWSGSGETNVVCWRSQPPFDHQLRNYSNSTDPVLGSKKICHSQCLHNCNQLDRQSVDPWNIQEENFGLRGQMASARIDRTELRFLKKYCCPLNVVIFFFEDRLTTWTTEKCSRRLGMASISSGATGVIRAAGDWQTVFWMQIDVRARGAEVRFWKNEAIS